MQEKGRQDNVSGLEKALEIYRTLGDAESVKRVLNKNHGNVSRSAVELGVTRKTLYAWIERYGIDMEK